MTNARKMAPELKMLNQFGDSPPSNMVGELAAAVGWVAIHT